ncbi:hypothetical protein OIU76_012870 [Salix suchowensis]|nr:hypothetical protein OIU76_012870 [Salix suchowensis]
MNNHCHLCSLKGTKLGDLMGESWLKAHEQNRDCYMTLFLRESWGKTFTLLSQEGRVLSSPNRGFVGDLVKKRLKSFSVEFDHMYQKQSNWAETDASPSRHVKYTAQSLETMLSSLFQPKLSKSGRTKHNRLTGKIKDNVTDNFRLTLLGA